MKLVLASASGNRHDLLVQLKIPHTLHPAKIDEDALMHDDPKERLILIAQAKAAAVAPYAKNCLVLAADTNGFYRHKLIQKPKYKMDALALLMTLSGKSHSMLTGWYALNTRNQQTYSGVSETKIEFKNLGEGELTGYVNDHDVVSWAAGYSPINTIAAGFIESITGSLTGFTHGLPFEQIYPVLKQEGVL